MDPTERVAILQAEAEVLRLRLELAKVENSEHLGVNQTRQREYDTPSQTANGSAPGDSPPVSTPSTLAPSESSEHPLTWKKRRVLSVPTGMITVRPTNKNNLNAFETSPWALTNDTNGFNEFRRFVQGAVQRNMDIKKRWKANTNQAQQAVIEEAREEYPVLLFQHNSFTTIKVASKYLSGSPSAKNNGPSRSKRPSGNHAQRTSSPIQVASNSLPVDGLGATNVTGPSGLEAAATAGLMALGESASLTSKERRAPVFRAAAPTSVPPDLMTDVSRIQFPVYGALESAGWVPNPATHFNPSGVDSQQSSSNAMTESSIPPVEPIVSVPPPTLPEPTSQPAPKKKGPNRTTGKATKTTTPLADANINSRPRRNLKA